MASFHPIDFDPLAPPRPTTPPIRWGFVMVLLALCLLAGLVYGVPYMAGRAGYAYEAGRARAAGEALGKLDKQGIVKESSALFRLASTAVAPAVVNISNWRTLPAAADRPAPTGGMARVGSGSGVVIDKARGYVVTNNHVVQGADRIGVRLGRGEEATARLVGTDPKTDLAVLQVGLPFAMEARWGDSDGLDIGDWVLAIGSPFELDRTVTAGIVSATGRSNLRIVGEGSYEDFVQTDAAINPGNSGGPLVDMKGEVIGINAAILSESGGNQGIGLAISSALARRVVDELIRTGRVARGYLGVILDDIGGSKARELKLPDGEGALVVDIQPEGPADRAGLKAGDVIIALDGKAVTDRSALRNRTAALATGARVPVRYLREGEARTAVVTIAELPALLALGLRLRELTPEQARTLPGAPESALLVEDVLPGSAAQRAGLIRGVRLLGIGAVPVQTEADCNAAVANLDPAKGIPLRLRLPDGREGIVTIGGSRPGR